ncbi:MAG: hypothetical protein JW852_03930, partial [Spirochaetales bacterium]|nr:hypothetical protein [Spirochaetales bacterium]
MKRITPDVPTILRVFFMIHAFVDVVIAVPLFFFPWRFLELLGWTMAVEPVTARLAAAALFAIGIESLIGSRGTSDSFISLLNLNILWSFFAVCGLLISIAELSWQ